MDDQKFEELVQAGIDAIPERFIDKLDNVAIVIEDEPTPQQRRELKLQPGSNLYGLYEGIPLPKRGSNYTLVLPDKITIFKNPILESTSDENQVRELVAETVWHEIAHHFGLDESEVHRRELHRRAKNGSEEENTE